MERDLTAILAGKRRIKLEGGLELRLLSAMEVLEARHEAAVLAEEDRERALCSNACLLARAMERGGTPVFEDGEAVLRGMTALEIEELARRWAAFHRGENPSPEDGEERVEPLKKAWSTRLLSALCGACSAHLGRSQRKNGPET